MLVAVPQNVWHFPQPFGDLPITLHDLLEEYIGRPCYEDLFINRETNNNLTTPQTMNFSMHAELEAPEPDQEGTQAFLDWLKQLDKECPPAPKKPRRSHRLMERNVPITKIEYDSTDSEEENSSDYEEMMGGIKTLMKWKEENKQLLDSKVQCKVCGRMYAYRRRTLHARTKSHRKAMMTAFDS